MHFTESLLIGLVTAYHNQQRKETAWFFGKRNINNPDLLTLNSNTNLSCYTLKKNI